MDRLIGSAAIALAVLTPTVASAELVKGFTVTSGFRYSTAAPAIGWRAVDPTNFGYGQAVWLWPASKGVAKALGRLDKTKIHSCTIEYDPDTTINAATSVYFNVYKARCTPLP